MESGLSAEQLRRMEENRRKALAKRAEKLGNPPSHSLTKHSNAVPKTDITNRASINQQGHPSLTATKVQCTVQKMPNLNHQDRTVQNTSHQDRTVQNTSHQDRTVQNTSHQDRTVQNTNHQDRPVQNTSHQDRIEQNRLKALAKRAEKLTKSPIKMTATSYSQSSHQPTGVNNPGKSLIAKINKDSVSVINKQSGTLSGGNVHSSVSSISSSRPTFTRDSSHLNTAVSSRTQPFHLNNSATLNSNTSKPSTFQSTESSNFSTNSMNLSNTENPSVGWNAFESVGKGAVKGKCVLVTRDRFSVEIGYSAPLIQCYKTMETKLYDAVTKKWSFRLVEYNKFINATSCLRPAVDIEPLPKAILQAFDSQLKGGNPVRTVPIADLSKVEPTLVNSLMSFQREGVNFGVYKNGRVLIADDMGLGKTIQAICLASYYRSEWPLLVVVPSSVRFDWAQQIQRWIPSIDPQNINVAVTGKDSCISGLVNIISYDLMSRKADILKAKKFQVIIMDECHLLKNFKTARCKAATPLLQIARRVIMLSGTPALSRPSELYTQLSAICPYLFKYHEFGVRYCDGKQLQWGWDFSGSSNMAELQLLLEEKIMIRRLKKEVLSELPDKLRQMVQLDPSFIKVDKGLQNASKVMGKLKKTEERGALLDFFHKSGTAKIKAIKNYVLDLLEGERKFIIFAHHGNVLDEIEVVVKSKIDSNYMRIDGKTGSEQRNFFCKKFQHNESVRVAILSITAANAGLNLSAANLVVFAELFWNPGILVQAEDRAHRIGQRDLVSVNYLVATGTSDDHIWPMIQKKLDVLGKAGLTKDNFASAETTTFVDQQQEQITKFLEESFSADFECMNQLDSDDGGQLDGDQLQTKDSKPCVFKQESILKYTSPIKGLPIPSVQSEFCVSPSKRKRQKNLFQYYSPSKSSTRQDENRDKSEGQDQPVEEFLDDDFDELLVDELEIGLPPNKKVRSDI